MNRGTAVPNKVPVTVYRTLSLHNLSPLLHFSLYTNFCLALNYQHSVFKWLLSHEVLEVLPSKTHSTDEFFVPISTNYTVWPLLIFVHLLQEEFPESGAALCRHEHFPEFSRTVLHAESGGQVGQLKVDSPRYVCTW